MANRAQYVSAEHPLPIADRRAGRSLQPTNRGGTVPERRISPAKTDAVWRMPGEQHGDRLPGMRHGRRHLDSRVGSSRALDAALRRVHRGEPSTANQHPVWGMRHGSHGAGHGGWLGIMQRVPLDRRRHNSLDGAKPEAVRTRGQTREGKTQYRRDETVCAFDGAKMGPARDSRGQRDILVGSYR